MAPVCQRTFSSWMRKELFCINESLRQMISGVAPLTQIIAVVASQLVLVINRNTQVTALNTFSQLKWTENPTLGICILVLNWKELNKRLKTTINSGN